MNNLLPAAALALAGIFAATACSTGKTAANDKAAPAIVERAASPAPVQNTVAEAEAKPTEETQTAAAEQGPVENVEEGSAIKIDDKLAYCVRRGFNSFAVVTANKVELYSLGSAKMGTEDQPGLFNDNGELQDRLFTGEATALGEDADHPHYMTINLDEGTCTVDRTGYVPPVESRPALSEYVFTLKAPR